MKTRTSRELPPIKVRREPPTLDEAIVAAQGLAEDVEQQVAIVAGLMALPEAEVRPSVLQAAPLPPARAQVGRGAPDAPRRPVVVVVERRTAGRAVRPSVREISGSR